MNDSTERSDAARVQGAYRPRVPITADEYDRLLAVQDGHCALCPNKPKTRRLHVDHDHRTGRIRGLLCHRCNRVMWPWVTREWALRVAEYVA
jgi:hypothetical protein